MPSVSLRSILILMAVAGLLSAGPFNFVASYNASGGYNDAKIALSDAQALAVGGGKMYVSDRQIQGVVVMVGDKVVDRIGGSGIASDALASPTGMFWTPNALYVADKGKAGVMVYLGGSLYSRVGPLASEGRLPSALWVSGDSLWMVDNSQDNVVEYDLRTGWAARIRLARGLGSGQISQAGDMWMGDGRIYIADTGNNRIEVLDSNWSFVDNFGTGRGGLTLLMPKSVSAQGGRLYVADTGNRRVVVLNEDGYPLEILNGTGEENGTFVKPVSVRVEGSMLYVLDAGAGKVATFALNWTDSEPAVLAEMDALNRTVDAHQRNIIDVMDRLNLSHAPFGGPAKLAAALALAQNRQYGEAAARLADARVEMAAVQLPQRQALRTELQMRIDTHWSVLEYYQGVPLSSEQAYRRTVLTNRINDAQARLNSGDYAGSTELVLALEADLTAFRQEMDAARNAQINQSEQKVLPEEPPPKKMLRAQAAALQARLEILKQKAAAVNSSDAYLPVETLISSGNTLAEVGAYSDANDSLQAAATQLAGLESGLQLRQARVDNASKSIRTAWLIFNDSKNSGQMLGVDTQPITDKLKQAQDMLYQQPQQAADLAQQAIEQTKLEATKVTGRGVAMGAVIAAVVAIGLVGLVAGWMVADRRRRL